MKEVYAFGDSILKGVIFENDKYKICKKRFSNICSDILNITIENNAKFGSTIQGGVKSLEKCMEEISNPNVKYVVMEFGGNDCDFNWNEISENPNQEHFSKQSIHDFVIQYSKIIHLVKENNKKVVLLSLPPIDSIKFFNKVSENLSKENILQWMKGNLQFLTNWHERYNLEIFKLARKENCSIIDITSKFLEQKDYSQFLCMDGIHPNEKGHQLIAEAILEHVLQRNICFD